METEQQEQRVWATVPEAGELLGLTRSRAYELASQNRLPGVVRLSPKTLRVHLPTLERELLKDGAGAGK